MAPRVCGTDAFLIELNVNQPPALVGLGLSVEYLAWRDLRNVARLGLLVSRKG